MHRNVLFSAYWLPLLTACQLPWCKAAKAGSGSAQVSPRQRCGVSARTPQLQNEDRQYVCCNCKNSSRRMSPGICEASAPLLHQLKWSPLAAHGGGGGGGSLHHDGSIKGGEKSNGSTWLLVITPSSGSKTVDIGDVQPDANRCYQSIAGIKTSFKM